MSQPTSALVEVTSPPPPARVEMVPDEPPATTGRPVWVDGEWTWRRERWSWLPGRWVIPPPLGPLFSPWVFERAPDGRLWYAPGGWRSILGAPVDAPPPLLTATFESGAVVTAEGATEITGPTVRARARAASSASAAAATGSGRPVVPAPSR